MYTLQVHSKKLGWLDRKSYRTPCKAKEVLTKILSRQYEHYSIEVMGDSVFAWGECFGEIEV